MSFRRRVNRLERVIGQPDDPKGLPPLTRDEMAVRTLKLLDRMVAGLPLPDRFRLVDDSRPLSRQERQKFRSAVALQIQTAKAVKAAGRLPEVLASLRAKGCLPLDAGERGAANDGEP